MITDTVLFCILIVVIANMMFDAFERVGYQFTVLDRVSTGLLGVVVFLASVAITSFINSLF